MILGVGSNFRRAYNIPKTRDTTAFILLDFDSYKTSLAASMIFLYLVSEIFYMWKCQLHAKCISKRSKSVRLRRIWRITRIFSRPDINHIHRPRSFSAGVYSTALTLVSLPVLRLMFPRTVISSTAFSALRGAGCSTHRTIFTIHLLHKNKIQFFISSA